MMRCADLGIREISNATTGMESHVQLLKGKTRMP